jgi:plastocyanin
VTYSGTAAAPKKLEVTKDVAVCGKEGHVDESLVVGANKGIKDVVVSIKGVKQGKSMEALGASFVLDQKVCAYRPHVLVLPVNKPVKILNSDGILHNIHTYSKKNPAKNIAQPKFKKELTETFAQPEVIAVKCDVHGWMSAWIVVVDHPYYAVTDENGKFTSFGRKNLARKPSKSLLPPPARQRLILPIRRRNNEISFYRIQKARSRQR